jgi:glycosyltransferase involved in cell wall biosynthesis
MAAVSEPLVSVGIPTYNRAAELQRAIASAAAQTHARLEIVVCDDASTDATEAAVRGLAGRDPRVRYVRQPANVGHARNFQAALEHASGEYFMWLSDDDHLDPGYVADCLAALLADGCAAVHGLARYESADGRVVDERPMDLLSTRPGARVLRYFLRVNINGALFSVARRRDLLEIGFADAVGGDWRLVAALAARGRVRTLRHVRIHRSMDGLSSDRERLARSFGLRGLAARHHHVLVAARLGREVALGSAFCPPLRRGNVLLGGVCALVLLLRFPGTFAARALLRRLGLEGIEDRVTAWVRTRD